MFKSCLPVWVLLAVAALWAAYSDDPLGFFQVRVLANILSAIAFAVSIFIKRPLIGIIVRKLSASHKYRHAHYHRLIFGDGKSAGTGQEKNSTP